ncbi:hypothetical protein LJC22_02990 [Desulfosarcina sp. OttesenSCG-928-G10]|nr:hypothetical protein [Desulfosarcina sp. OttesenSCG-928-G10]MDL2322040.1 hypothetical protein [Desulfosarcina sp. OttesenSCG-928-B08]
MLPDAIKQFARRLGIGKQNRSSGNETGSVIVIVLVVLVLAALLGIAATNTSTVEVQIATNDQILKMAFYNADSAVYATAKLISLSVDEGCALSTSSHAPGVSYLQTGSHFYRQIAGITDYDDGDPDVDFATGGINATADVRRIGHRHAHGSSAEFGAGTEGASAGALIIEYEIHSTGTTDRGGTAELSATYRKVVGVSGGL